MNNEKKQADTSRRTSPRGDGRGGPDAASRERIVSADRNTGALDNSQRRHPGETPRDKPVEEEADKDVKHGGT